MSPTRTSQERAQRGGGNFDASVSKRDRFGAQHSQKPVTESLCKWTIQRGRVYTCGVERVPGGCRGLQGGSQRCQHQRLWVQHLSRVGWIMQAQTLAHDALERPLSASEPVGRLLSGLCTSATVASCTASTH